MFPNGCCAVWIGEITQKKNRNEWRIFLFDDKAFI